MKVFEQEPGSRKKVITRRPDNSNITNCREIGCDHGQLELRFFNSMHTIECRSCGQVWKDYDFIQPALNKSRPIEESNV